MRKGQTHKTFSKYFTERRMDIEVAEETRAEEVKVEGALSIAG